MNETVGTRRRRKRDARPRRASLRLHPTPGTSPPGDAQISGAEQRQGGIGLRLERLSQRVAQWTGSSLAFTLALATIVIWALTGPIFGYSNTWQLVINTATTIVTFLMVFLIQRAQNKYTRAIELKINELIAALQGASNRLIDIEDLSEDELQRLHEKFRTLVERSRHDASRTAKHSVEEEPDAT